MLRPERMSRVSVTGSKGVMDDAIEAVHDLRLLHVTEYDGSWDGFEPGDPVEGADEASGKLVTIRALKSVLDVTGEEVSPTNRVITEEALGDELEAVREEVNELDDRRDQLRDDLREVEERIDAMEPFVALGIDLHLLGGYDSLAVSVGDGDADSVEAALGESDIEAYETVTADGVVAVFAYTDEETLQDTLVDATFTAIEIPVVHEADATDPEEYLEHLRHRKQQLESKLSTVESELEDLKLEVGGFLLAAEEELTIDVQQREAPLSFATTENAFVAEGWIPTERYDEFESALTDAVGDHILVQELERADYDGDGHAVDREEVHGGEEPDSDREPGGVEQPTAADGRGADSEGEQARTDGGTVTMGGDEPPVIQDNPEVSKPFELLVRVINRPRYTEFDPTVILLLTFPFMFGFMIGDVGYGVLYVLVGWALYTRLDSAGWQALGGIAVWSGVFTILFGVLYGEIFGLHTITSVLWEGLLGLHGPPMHKGLQPADVNFARAWLVLSFVFGLLHLTLGYVLGFLKDLRHGFRDAVFEDGSWILMMVGVWAFIFSRAAESFKPDFLFRLFATPGTEGAVYPIGFAGLSPTVGFAGVGLFVLGFLMLAFGEPIEVVEFLQVLVNVLSYARIPAVLLAKAGMAFVVNLLFFGAYAHDGEFHFLTGQGPGPVVEEFGREAIMFPGLIHLGIAGVLFGLIVLVLGHLLVLALGITSAGLQAVRLEYVEFFSKFYEGGGSAFTPFGKERLYTADE